MADRLVIAAIPVEVRRSKRRRTRIGISFDPSGRVVMEAPLDASEADIRAIIHRHQAWLKSRLDAAQASSELSGCLRYDSGETVHYRGAPYQLVVIDGEADAVALHVYRSRDSRQLPLLSGRPPAGNLRVVLGPASKRQAGVQVLRSERVHLLLNAWYKARAEALFARQFDYFRPRLDWLHQRTLLWRHRFMRSQWGSCSHSGRIALNTHLVKLPHRLTRYVVLHELCHLRHHDHGPGFYALMSRYMPDWQVRRAELDRYLPVLLQD
jgi:predicted metal-dependent hydrolase